MNRKAIDLSPSRRLIGWRILGLQGQPYTQGVIAIYTRTARVRIRQKPPLYTMIETVEEEILVAPAARLRMLLAVVTEADGLIRESLEQAAAAGGREG